MNAPRIKRLAVIGVGLIGGSLARALREAGAVDEIIGAGRDPARLQQAIDLGVIDAHTTSTAEACADADMVVLAVPVGEMRAIFESLRPVLTDAMTITDVGSTKGNVLDAASAVFGAVPPNFVPGHPIAGTEKSGVGASFAGLFKHRRVILTPTEWTSTDALQRVRAMWQAVGADVVETSVAHHDEVLAATSHLPHMLAYALVDTLARMNDSREIFDYAAGGFRDFTRIASSNPAMWHDICFANRDALLQMMQRFITDLEQLAAAIRAGDSDYLLQTFERAKQARDDFCAQQGNETLSPE